MGNRKNTITWSWPLISLEWIPEILSSFENLLEPSWAGLRRQMTTDVQNSSFANRILSQLQTLLLETSLVEERGRHIHPAVSGNSIGIKTHLVKIVEESNSDWAQFFRIIYKDGIELHFDSIDHEVTKLWPDITNYSIFKQWSEFFQYLGFGILLSHDHFIPETAIKTNMINDTIFIERCLKAIGDPRYLTGSLSLHTESDFLAWTIGEEHLPITEDPTLFPRIPHEVIVQESKKNSTQKGSWRAVLSKGTEEWAHSIEEILSIYPFSSLGSLIYTCKYLLDYFLFGRSIFHTDSLDKDKLVSIRRRWTSVKHFMISEHIWKILPNMYRDITRLHWGISFYRNSFHKPFQRYSVYDEEIFNFGYPDQLKGISIRCFRSKRTLFGILKFFLALFKTLTRLKEKKLEEYYESETNRIYNNTKKYLPSNPLETSELLNQLEGIIDLHPNEILSLLNPTSFDITTGYKKEGMLNLCFWVHRYHELSEDPHIKSLHTIQNKLDIMEVRIIKDCEYYNKGLFKWKKSCERVKDKMRAFRTN